MKTTCALLLLLSAVGCSSSSRPPEEDPAKISAGAFIEAAPNAPAAFLYTYLYGESEQGTPLKDSGSSLYGRAAGIGLLIDGRRPAGGGGRIDRRGTVTALSKASRVPPGQHTLRTWISTNDFHGTSSSLNEYSSSDTLERILQLRDGDHVAVCFSFRWSGTHGAGISYKAQILVRSKAHQIGTNLYTPEPPDPPLASPPRYRDESLGLTAEQGLDGRVRIVEVPEGSPARAAGLQKADLVLRVWGNDWAVDPRSLKDFKRACDNAFLFSTPAGETIQLKVQREGTVHTLSIRGK